MKQHGRKTTNPQAKITPRKSRKGDKFKELEGKVRSTFCEQGLPTKGMNFIKPPDGIKMSEVILKIAEPLLKKFGDSDERIETIISLTILVWNNLLLPEDEQEKFQDKIINSLIPSNGNAEDVVSIISISDMIAERKNRYFPDINKIVVNYDLKILNGNVTLNISSVPFKDGSR